MVEAAPARPTGPTREHAAAVLLEVLDRSLRLLHPFMPFITEEIWQAIPRRPEDGLAKDGVNRSIALAPFPQPEPAWQDDAACATVELLQEVITSIRTARAERGVPPSRRLTVLVEGADEVQARTLADAGEYIRRLAGLEALELAASVPRSPDTVRQVVRGLQIHIPLAGIVDRQAEQERIRKDLARLDKQLANVRGKLANPAFRERADPDVVRETEAQLVALGSQREKLERILAELVE